MSERDGTLVGASAPAAAEEVMAGLRGLVVAAATALKGFRARVPGMDDHDQAPFALDEIARAGRRGLSQVDIARALGMSPSSATRLIDSLEAADLVRREPHPNDRRIKQVVLTVVGRALLADLMADLERNSRRAGLDRDALAAVGARLSRLSVVVQP